MPPFNNRPPIAFEPLTLGSGDIEAVEYAPRIPGFPPQPVARHPSPLAPPPHHAGPGRRVPSPSPSLAPVSMYAAMNAGRDRADASGPQRASVETIVLRSRPTLKMGFSILMASVILGGVLGITTRSRAAVAAYEPSVEMSLGSSAKEDDALPTTKKPADKDDAKTDKTETASSDDTTKESAKPSAKKKRFTGAVAKTTAAPPAPKAAKPEKPSKDDDDGYRVASANKDDEPAARPAKAAKKPAKTQDDDDDAPPPPPKAASKKPKASSDDAASVLKAAMGATENTL